MLSRQGQIWSRAALEAGGEAPREGDSALASLLQAHGLVMNGGVVHAQESLGQAKLADAVAGFRYFGLSVVAEVLSHPPDDSEETEERLNAAYWKAVPDDSILAHAFRVKLLQFPEAFAPVVPGTHA